jgi:hypothetical protein
MKEMPLCEVLLRLQGGSRRRNREFPDLRLQLPVIVSSDVKLFSSSKVELSQVRVAATPVPMQSSWSVLIAMSHADTPMENPVKNSPTSLLSPVSSHLPLIGTFVLQFLDQIILTLLS